MESVNVHIIDASFTSLKWKHITWIIKGGLSYFFFSRNEWFSIECLLPQHQKYVIVISYFKKNRVDQS